MTKGKKAIIVGASSGIGYEVARLLLQEGWRLGLAARRTETLEALRREFQDMWPGWGGRTWICCPRRNCPR